jgi:hypothetical protein
MIVETCAWESDTASCKGARCSSWGRRTVDAMTRVRRENQVPASTSTSTGADDRGPLVWLLGAYGDVQMATSLKVPDWKRTESWGGKHA